MNIKSVPNMSLSISKSMLVVEHEHVQEHVEHEQEHVEHEHQDERRENVSEGVDSSEGLSERRHECMGSEVA